MENILQKMFNKSYLGLKAQEFQKSVSVYGSCMYRALNGCKCAIGHHIPDDKYHSRIEGKSISHFDVRLAAGISSREEVIFASELQTAHDYSNSPKDMEKRLRAVASEHSLTIPMEG